MGAKKKQDDRHPIFAIIDKGDDDAFAELLKSDPTVKDLKNKDGWSPLIAASYCGELEMVSSLIKSGADVKASCKDGDTALHYASAQGHMDIITLLAKSGAKLDVKDRDGETPYNVAGKNLKVRKLIQQLMSASLEDDSEGEKADAEGDDGEWEECNEPEVAEAVERQ